jgi:hypothetical protein
MAEHQPGDVVQSIFVPLDYDRLLAMKGGMTFWFTLDEATFGVDGRATHRFLQVFYWDPPEKGHKGSPFGGDEAARQYWLEGSPSRLETSVRRAFADFAGITQLFYPHAGERDFNPLKSEWGKSLATLGELKQQGVRACRGAECRRPYLKLDGDRVWFLPESMPANASFQSVPLTVWN